MNGEYYPWIDVAVILGGMTLLSTWAFIGAKLDKRKAKRSFKHF